MKRKLRGDDSLFWYLAQKDTLYQLDSTVCDSTWEQTMTDINGNKFFVNLETNCDKFYSRVILDRYLKKKVLYLTPNEWTNLINIIKVYGEAAQQAREELPKADKE